MFFYGREKSKVKVRVASRRGLFVSGLLARGEQRVRFLGRPGQDMPEGYVSRHSRNANLQTLLFLTTAMISDDLQQQLCRLNF